VLHGDCFGNHVWRMADCQDDGHKNHQASTPGQLLCGNGCGPVHHWRISCRHPREHDTHDHRCYYGCWINEKTIGSPLGCGGKHYLGLDFNDPDLRHIVCRHLFFVNGGVCLTFYKTIKFFGVTSMKIFDFES